MARTGLAAIGDYWQGIAAIGAIVALLATLWVRGAVFVAVPAQLDSLRTAVRQHADTAEKYGRMQVQLQRQILCVLVAQTSAQKERCVMSVLGEQP